MILNALLLAAAQAGGPAQSDAERSTRCIDRAAADPIGAQAEARAWRSSGGGFLARQCLGMALAGERLWSAAAAEFEAAAVEAAAAGDARAANLRAQAGNAWLAGGDAVKAKTAFDAALADATFVGVLRGEAFLDRARARVALEDTVGGRSDLDQALALAKDDPLAWLLSATLARRAGDLTRASHDIGEALARAADDAQVQLEAGNIAALRGDEAAARIAWGEAVRLAPKSPAGTSATKALQQFSTP